MPTNTRILIAVDESEASERAVEYVAQIARGNADLHVGLLHLELPPRMLEWGGSENPEVEARVSRERARAYHEMETGVIEHGQSLLHRFDELLARKGIDVTAELIQFEEPLDTESIAKHIIDCAGEGDYGTIVVGRNSFSGLRRMFQRDFAGELMDRSKNVSVWLVD